MSLQSKVSTKLSICPLSVNVFVLGLVTLAGFLYFWGWVFLITTTLVAVFKKETEPHDPEHEVVIERDVKTAYTSLIEILKLAPMKTLVILLLTCKVRLIDSIEIFIAFLSHWTLLLRYALS